MRPDDLIRLRHMLESAREAVDFMVQKRRQDLDDDRVLLPALMKAIEIIGEAVSKVSEQTKAKYDSIPWRQIVGMRNRLIHAYYRYKLGFIVVRCIRRFTAFNKLS
jgi:uncharacterized protein with HEPN domain